MFGNVCLNSYVLAFDVTFLMNIQMNQSERLTSSALYVRFLQIDYTVILLYESCHSVCCV